MNSTSYQIDTASDSTGELQQYQSRRSSSIVDTSHLLSFFVKKRIRTLAFCRTRKLTELVLKYCCQDLTSTAPDLLQSVKGYRGGYTKVYY